MRRCSQWPCWRMTTHGCVNSSTPGARARPRRRVRKARPCRTTPLPDDSAGVRRPAPLPHPMPSHLKTILPAAVAAGAQASTLGVMGGGQLGRMFVHAAQRLGYFTAVLDPDVASPAGLVSHVHVQTDYLDEQGLAQMLQRCAAIPMYSALI
eukprot:Opistho-2@38070